MHKYVIKRLLYMIPVLLGVAFLVFTILSLTPGDPGSIILGITAKPEDIAALNAEFGYDQPLSFSISVWEPPIRPASR